MIDFINMRIDNTDIIKGLIYNLKEKGIKPFEENNFHSKFRESTSISYDFQKVGEYSEVGYCFLKLKPHYYYNNNRHNGNLFSVKDCLITICDMLQHVGIPRIYFDELKLVGLEFGLNLVLKNRVEVYIDNLLFTKRSEFITEYANYKRSDTADRKIIKAYAKSLQPAKGFDKPNHIVYKDIDRNTFRFEIKSKKSSYLKPLGINTIDDLMKEPIYERLFNEVLKEWDNILIFDKNISFEIKTVKEWVELAQSEKGKAQQNKLIRKRKQFYKNPNHIHNEIRGKIVEKKVSLFSHGRPKPITRRKPRPTKGLTI